MRTLAAGQRAIVSAARIAVYPKVEITDPDGAWRDVSAELNGIDWLNTAQIRADRDANSLRLTMTLLREIAANYSLSPLMTGSLVNRNAATAYAPMLDLRRKWRIKVAVLPPDTAPVGGDYKELGNGFIDNISFGGSRSEITTTGRDAGALLLDGQIRTKRQYGSVGGVAMETVIQAIVDDNQADNAYPATVLYVPAGTSPGYLMNPFEVDADQSVMQAINTVAAKAGRAVNFRYDAADVNRLTLFKPNRTVAVEDFVLGPTEYLDLPLVELDWFGVRNIVQVRYVDAAGVIQTVISPIGLASASIDRYNKNFFGIDLSYDRQVNDAVKAQGFADYVRMDLENAPLTQQIVSYGLWFVQLGDYVKCLANGVHYDTDQYGGVIGFTHVIGGGTMKTTVDLAGKPTGRFRTWLSMGTDKGTPTTGGVVLPDFSEVATESADGTTGTLAISVRSDLQNRVTSCVFRTVSGRGGEVVLATQYAQPFAADVALSGSNKTPSKIEYQIFGTDAAGTPNAELRRGSVRFGVGSKPMDPDFKFSISAAGKPTVYLLGDSDTSYGKALLTSDAAPDFAAIDATGVESTHGNRLGTMNDIGTVVPGRQYWIGVVAYNKDGVASAPVVKSGVWMGLGVTPVALVTVNSIVAQSGRITFNLTLNNTATDLYIYVLETDTDPAGTPSVENRVATHFRDFSVGEPGIAQGVPWNLSIPILRDNNILLVTLVPYDYMGQRGTAVATKTPGVGGSPPAVPGAPTAVALSKTSTTVTNRVTLFGSGTNVDKIRPYVDGVAQADFDVAPDSASGNYDVVSTGFIPSSTHTFRYTSVSAAGVESATSSATLTITTNSDTSGGGGGTGLNGRVPQPVVSASGYTASDQASHFTITPDAAIPYGTVFHVERSDVSGSGYVEDNPAQTTSYSVRSAYTQTSVAHDAYYRLRATCVGWANSPYTAEIHIVIPIKGPDL